MPTAAVARIDASLSAPSVWRAARQPASGGTRGASARLSSVAKPAARDELPLPDFLRAQPDIGDRRQEAPPITLAQLADLVAAHLALGGTVAGLAACCGEPSQSAAVIDAIHALQAELGDEGLAWLRLALWVSQRPGDDGNPSVAAWLAEPAARARLAVDRRQRCLALLDRKLGHIASDAWPQAVPAQSAPIPSGG